MTDFPFSVEKITTTAKPRQLKGTWKIDKNITMRRVFGMPFNLKWYQRLWRRLTGKTHYFQYSEDYENVCVDSLVKEITESEDNRCVELLSQCKFDGDNDDYEAMLRGVIYDYRRLP